MSIQYLSDEVIPIPPNGMHSDWQATITIVFSVKDDVTGELAPALLYQQQIAGGVNEGDLISKFQVARPLITDSVLLAYANLGSAILYTPPTPTEDTNES